MPFQERRDETDVAAWLAVITAYEHDIGHYLAKTAFHDEIAKADLFAAIRYSAWVNRATLVTADNPGKQLMEYARAACREWVATHRRERPLATSGRANTDAAGSSTPVFTLSVDEGIARQRWAERMLATLSEHQRIVVDFRVRWGFSTAYIAAVMNITEATVRVHLWRGLRRLRQTLVNDPFPSAFGSDD